MTEEKENSGCGYCKFMKWEDIYGWGTCDYHDKEVLCSQKICMDFLSEDIEEK